MQVLKDRLSRPHRIRVSLPPSGAVQIELVGKNELPVVMTTAPDRDGLFLDGVQLLPARDFSLHRYSQSELPAAREYVRRALQKL